MTDVETQAAYVFNARIPRSNSYLSSVDQQAPVFDTRRTRQVTKTALSTLVSEMEQRIVALQTEAQK